MISAWRDKLLASLHRIFDHDAHAVIAFRVRHVAWCAWRVANNVLTLETSSGVATSIQLEGHTMTTLAEEIRTLPGYDVIALHPDIADRSALILLDGTGRQDVSNGDALSAYTSLLWALLHAMGLGLAGAATDSRLAVDQIHFDRAGGEWLDLHGSYYGILRKLDEIDAEYLSRIIAEILIPRSNNFAVAWAIEILFGATRGTVSVVDAPIITYDPALPSGHTAGYGEFDVIIAEPPIRNVTLDALLDALDAFKAAGTRMRQATITWQFGPRTIGIASITSSPAAVSSAHFGAQSYEISSDNLVEIGVAAVLPAPFAIRSVHLRGV
jgi:hypothetical protein